MTETLWERVDRARMFFDAQDYITAARMLSELVSEVPEDGALRLLLARAYYHSAQLSRAENELRLLLAQDPASDYTHLLLGRTLQRQSRHAEAHPHLRMAAVMTGEG